MVDIKNKSDEIDVDIYLKITNDSDRSAFDIVEEHIKVTEKNPGRYTWWGNNQQYSPGKVNEFKNEGYFPKALIVIPHTSGGSDNIEFIADIIDSIKLQSKGYPPDNCRPKYYFDTPYKVWLKLANFKRVIDAEQDYNIEDYFLIKGNEQLKLKISSQYACGYVYRKKDIYTRTLLDESTQQVRGFLEGERRLKQHIRIERNRNLIKEAKKEFKRKHGKLFCEVCKFDFYEKYGKHGEDFIEAHHVIPISSLNSEVANKIEDIVMLCSNCHSMIHRNKECLSIEELKKILAI